MALKWNTQSWRSMPQLIQELVKDKRIQEKPLLADRLLAVMVLLDQVSVGHPIHCRIRSAVHRTNSIFDDLSESHILLLDEVGSEVLELDQHSILQKCLNLNN